MAFFATGENKLIICLKNLDNKVQISDTYSIETKRTSGIRAMEVISRKEAKEQGLKRYFTGKPCKHGHASERQVSDGKCCVCVAERVRKWHEQNKEKILEKKREYYEQNKDRVADKYRKWRKANPEHEFIRNSLQRILSNWKGGRAKAEKLLGYTCEQLREHIESQFKEGMSWDDRGKFHIDHIKPIKAFLDEGITDPAIVNALDNLQPLWAHENLSKGAKHER